MASINLTLSDVKFGTKMSDIKVPDYLLRNVETGVDWFDEVLGGSGLTPSQVLIFTGDPGAGKTTGLMVIADSLGKNPNNIVIYNSAEESVYQLKKVIDRLRLKGNFLVGNEKCIDDVVEKCNQIKAIPGNEKKDVILIVDSIQQMEAYSEKYKRNIDSANLVTERMIAFSKQTHAVTIAVGQVTKGGVLAGSNKMKHAVDTHVHLGVEDKDEDIKGARVLEIRKNRFGGGGHIIFLTLNKTGFTKISTIEFG